MERLRLKAVCGTMRNHAARRADHGRDGVEVAEPRAVRCFSDRPGDDHLLSDRAVRAICRRAYISYDKRQSVERAPRPSDPSPQQSGVSRAERPQCHRVPDRLVRSALGRTGLDDDTVGSEPSEDLGLILRRHRRGTNMTSRRLPLRFWPSPSPGELILDTRHPVRPFPVPAVHDGQPVDALELAACIRERDTVLPDTRFCAVPAKKRHGD